MKIFVNNTELELFRGARAKDAVRAYYRSMEETEDTTGLQHIFDPFGNTIDPDGELTDNAQLILIESENQTFNE